MTEFTAAPSVADAAPSSQGEFTDLEQRTLALLRANTGSILRSIDVASRLGIPGKHLTRAFTQKVEAKLLEEGISVARKYGQIIVGRVTN